MVVRLTKFKNCNLYIMPLLALLPIERNMIILHRLPVEERIIFKNLLLVKTILSNEAPLYLYDFDEFYVPGRINLRPTKSNVLILKRKDTKTTCKNYGWRDFRVFAPFLWNDLPVFIRQTESIDNFKKRSKTHLFVRHFR